jgi:ADP-heptose:LPS heptosyltransferase
MDARRRSEILTIHPGALGDVLQAVPALTALRGFEGARVVFAGQTHIAELLAGVGAVDAAVSFESLGLWALFADDSLPFSVESRLSSFDRVVSWFGAGDAAFRDRLRAVVPRALVAPPAPGADSALTVWKHLAATLAPWGVDAPGDVEPLAVPDAWRMEAGRKLSQLGLDPRRPSLLVHAGAGAKWKRWPAELLARVVRHVVAGTGCQVLVHQGPADASAVAELCTRLDLSTACLIEPALPLLAATLSEAGTYLGADSGVSHLAAAVGASAVILFPRATAQRWAPWSPTAIPLVVGDGGRDRDIESIAQAVGRCLATAAGRGHAPPSTVCAARGDKTLPPSPLG